MRRSIAPRFCSANGDCSLALSAGRSASAHDESTHCTGESDQDRHRERSQAGGAVARTLA
eukprot:70376-Prymnesium_polylepis.1